MIEFGKGRFTYAADVSGDGVGALVCSADHHLVDDDLFGAEDDSVATHDAHRRAAQ